MATATASPTRRRRTRDQVAEALLEILTDEPQSGAALARRLGYQESAGLRDTGSVRSGLDILVSRDQAKRIPDTPGQRNGGWCLFSSPHVAALVSPREIEFDYEFDKRLPLEQCFVDDSYQRPLTTFASKIERDFDPLLWQALMLSDRGPNHKPKRYAIIDGQTRWTAGTRIGIQHGPAQIFRNLSPEDEADIFWRIQKHRKGTVSWHRFRAQLRSGDERSHAIKALVEAAGYTLGEGSEHLRAMAALEGSYDIDPFELERALSDLREAWPDTIPEGTHITGLHFFFRHYPLDKHATEEVNDERLVRRLRTTGPDGLHRKANAAKEVGGRGTAARWMAMAIQGAYLSGGRS